MEEQFNKAMKELFTKLRTPAGMDVQGRGNAIFIKEINEIGNTYVKVNGELYVNYRFIESVWERGK